LAESYQELIEQYGITQEELSDIIHKSRTQITNTIRLLKLSEYTKKLLVSGKISQGHAKVLIGLDEKKQQLISDTIVGQKLSVRDSEELVKNLKQNEDREIVTKKSATKIAYNDDILLVVDKLDDLGLKSKRTANKLTIDFSNSDDLVRFLEILK